MTTDTNSRVPRYAFDLRVGDRFLAVFALVMFTVTLGNVLIVLATH